MNDPQSASGPFLRVIRWAWLAASVTILVIWLVLGPAEESVSSTLSLWLGLLTLPVGHVVSFFLALVGPFPMEKAVSVKSVLLLWGASVALGYFQWFWLVPRVFRRRENVARQA